MSVPETYHEAVPLADLRESGRELIAVDGVPIALFHHEGEVRAVNNRCPHMGFPLTEGTVDEGVLTCEWHHARFELSCGDTFDPWADDVETYPTRVEDGAVYVDPSPERDRPADELWMDRLEDGLEQNLRLKVAKAAVGLADAGVDPAEQVRAGVEFGTTYRQGGWSSGLTILTAMSNVLPRLDERDRQRAMYHGLVEVAGDCADRPPKFEQAEFETREVPFERLKSWFRENVEVRDADGAERVLRTAVATGCTPEQLTEMVAAAATEELTPDGVAAVVEDTTVDDAAAFYRAFDHVAVSVPDPPEGMEPLDVRRGSDAVEEVRRRSITLYDLLELSADRDGVAREWVEGYERSFRTARWIVDDDGPITDRAARSYLRLLSREPDTFVATSHGQRTAHSVMVRAQEAREGGPDLTRAFAESLVKEGINPGTTADLTAAGIFLALERGQVRI